MSGDTAVVGDPYLYSGTTDTPAAFVFTLSDGTWTQTAQLTNSFDGDFGEGVAVYGTTIVVGGGWIHIFTGSGPDWSETDDIGVSGGYDPWAIAATSSGIALGYAASAECGDFLLSGPTQVQIWTGSGSSWSESTALSVPAATSCTEDFYNSQLSWVDDTLVVGVPSETVDGNDASGAAYVYTGSGSSWSSATELTYDDTDYSGGAASGDGFAQSVATSGPYVVIGSFTSYKAYVFTNEGGDTWSSAADLVDPTGGLDNFGISVAISGTDVFVSANNDGALGDWGAAIDIYSQSGSSWPIDTVTYLSDGDGESPFIAVSGSALLAAENYGAESVSISVLGDDVPAATSVAPVALGKSSASANSSSCNSGNYPVDCASGDFWHTFTDYSIPTYGPALKLTRTYNSLEAGTEGMFGYGWSSSYGTSLAVDSDGACAALGDSDGCVTITEGDGSQVTANPTGSGAFSVPSWADSTLAETGGTYSFVRQGTQTFT